MEKNVCPKVTVFCEPQMGKYDLYPSISDKRNYEATTLMMNMLSYSDGETTLVEIAEKCEAPVWRFYDILEKLVQQKIVSLN